MDNAEFAAYPPPSPGEPIAQPLPFSRQAIWGFVISCVSLLVFGFIGLIGAVLSARGLRVVRQGRARGRGLAIAGMIIGAIGFLFYAIVFVWSNFR